MQLNSFVLADSKKCISCRVCEVACAVAHSGAAGKTVGYMTAPLIPRLYLVKTAEVTMPVQCHHCEAAPCVKSCQSACIVQTDNSVLIDESRCTGCKSCILACPFGAIELIAAHREKSAESASLLETGSAVVASKCDLCVKRPAGPACVEACPQNALHYVDFRQDRKRRQIRAAEAMGEIMQSFKGREG